MQSSDNEEMKTNTRSMMVDGSISFLLSVYLNLKPQSNCALFYVQFLAFKTELQIFLP